MAHNPATRIEKDSMGEMPVPAQALYGASTQRAVLNFPISGRPMPEAFIKSIGWIKKACAQANFKLGRLPEDKANLIIQAAKAIAEGQLTEHFPVDVFQTGSCTSSNMNANEVIANTISHQCGEAIGSKKPVHPNDDVNMGQSSNDTMPSVLHISVALALKNALIPALENMKALLDEKSQAWSTIIKIGRTHLMDATPLTLGQVFSGYKRQIEKNIEHLNHGITALQELAIGGTAVGTGINCHPDFPTYVCEALNTDTGLAFYEAKNHFEAQGARDDSVMIAGYLSTLCASLTKIANDIRLLGSGPRCGIGELTLPATQPGSSIMPGKVNPVMSEMLIQVCLYVLGLCQTVNMCGRDGHFELNVTIPVIAYALLDSIDCLTKGILAFNTQCLTGLTANKDECRKLVDQSLMLVTALNPYIGYDKAAYVAKKAFEKQTTLKAILLEEGLMEASLIDEALNPLSMIP
jgi:fumarate hydratase class II